MKVPEGKRLLLFGGVREARFTWVADALSGSFEVSMLGIYS